MPPATNVARRIDKVVIESGINACKGGGQSSKGQAYSCGDFSESKNHLNGDGLTTVPVDKCD